MTAEQRRIRCRFCAYSVPAYYSTAEGEVRSGFARMAVHIDRAHPDRADEIEEKSHTQRSDEAEEL